MVRRPFADKRPFGPFIDFSREEVLKFKGPVEGVDVDPTNFFSGDENGDDTDTTDKVRYYTFVYSSPQILKFTEFSGGAAEADDFFNSVLKSSIIRNTNLTNNGFEILPQAVVVDELRQDGGGIHVNIFKRMSEQDAIKTSKKIREIIKSELNTNNVGLAVYERKLSELIHLDKSI